MLGEIASDAAGSLRMRNFSVLEIFASLKGRSLERLDATYTNDGDLLDPIGETRRLVFGIFGRHSEVL